MHLLLNNNLLFAGRLQIKIRALEAMAVREQDGDLVLLNLTALRSLPAHADS